MRRMTVGQRIDNLIGRFRSSHDNDPADRSEISDFWYSPIGIPSWSGAVVTPETAIQVPAVWNCLKLIADPIAHLPLIIYQKQDDGGKKRVDSHPLFDVLHNRPNDEQTAYEFRGQMQWDLGIFNAAFAEIIPGRRGPIDQLIRLDPQRMTAKRVRPGGPIGYRYHEPDGRTRLLRSDQVWHLRGLPMSFDGVNPISPVLAGPARQTIGKALALMEYASRFFLNDTSGGGIIRHPGHFEDEQSRQNWLSGWRASRSLANRHRDSLLEEGMEYVRPGQTNREAQFNETAVQSNLEITRIWNVPPHMIGIMGSTPRSNIEQQALEFVSITLMPWIELWEQAISRDLMIAPGRFVTKFNVAGLLRGDLKTRYEAYAIGRNWGWLSVNDILKLENRNPIGENGDVHLQPLNMAPAGEVEPSGQGGRRPNGAGNGAAAGVIEQFESDGGDNEPV